MSSYFCLLRVSVVESCRIGGGGGCGGDDDDDGSEVGKSRSVTNKGS